MEHRNGHAKEVSIRCLDKLCKIAKDERGIPVLLVWPCRNRECRVADCEGSDPATIAVVHYVSLYGDVDLAAFAGYPEITIAQGERVTRCVPKPGPSELLAALREHQHGTSNSGRAAV